MMLKALAKRGMAYFLAFVMLLGMAPAMSITAGAVTEGAQEDTGVLLNEENTVEAFVVGGKGYTTLEEALAAASTGESKQVTMVKDYTLSASCIIPSGVHLVLPYNLTETGINGKDADHPFANSKGITQSGSTVPAEDGTLYPPGNTNATVTLTVNSGVTITIANGGVLAIGGTVGGVSGGCSGQTCREFSRVILNGTISVENGGKLSCCGYITGNGSVSAASGGEIYEPFVVCDYFGGKYSVVSYTNATNTAVSPFNRYAMFNIQTTMTLVGGATLWGYASLFTGEMTIEGIGTIPAQHNQCTSKIVGSGTSGALLNTSGAKLTFSYTPSYLAGKEVIGQTHIEASGGTVTYGGMTLNVSVLNIDKNVDTTTVDFPVPYNVSIDMLSGSLVLPSGVSVKMLPGSEIRIREGASLRIDGTLGVYDGLQTIEGGPTYPTSAELQAAYLSARGRLIVDGTLAVNGTFAGLVETEGATGIIKVGSGATLTRTFVEGVTKGDTGSSIAADFTNYTSRTLTAQLWDGSKLMNMSANENYYAYTMGSAGNHSVSGYTYYVRGADLTTEVAQNGVYTTAETAVGNWMTGGTITYVYGEKSWTSDPIEPTKPVSVNPPSEYNNLVPAGYELVWDGTAPTVMGRQNYVFTATERAKSYTVNYLLGFAGCTFNGSSVNPNPTTYTVESEDFTLINPSKTGYTFAGWTVNDGDMPASAMTVKKGTTGNLTFTANWTADSHDVTFNANGGKFGDNEQYIVPAVHGTAVSKPADPTREGYTFVGWYTDAGCTTAYTFSAYVTAPFTLYAKWTANTYTITLDANGGTGISDSITVTYNGDFSALPEPTRTGYGFDGWFTAAEGGTQVKNADTVQITADTTLYAQWTAQSMTITFNANMGSGTMDPQVITYDGTRKALNTNAFERTGYTFSGWNSAPDGSGVSYAADATFFGNEGGLTLYAQWAGAAGQLYLIEDVKNGEEYTFKTAAITFGNTYGSCFEGGELPSPSKTGHTFLGWFTAAENGTEVTSSQTIEYKDGGYIRIYAHWKVNTYSVTYKDENGSVLGTDEYAYGAPVTAHSPSKTGYTLSGWTDENAVSATVPDTMPAEDLVFIAVWQANTCTVTLDYNYEGSTNSSITVTYDGTYSALPSPSRTGYGFLGWFTKAEDGVQVKNSDTVTLTEGITLYAQWEVDSYTITYYDSDGTTVLGTATYPYGETIVTFTPEKVGHEFAGWEGYLPPTMPAEHLEVTAKWEKSSYTITWYVDGAENLKLTGVYDFSFNPEDVYNMYNSNSETSPEKAGYEFAGWYTDEECTGDPVTTLTIGAADVALYAGWTANTYTITLNPNGGSVTPSSITATYDDDYANLPTAPTKEGHEFAGWYTASTGGSKVENTDTVKITADTTLYARWTVKQYTITFNSNGGSEIGSITQNYGTAVTAPAAPTWTGYTFDGWDKTIPATMPAENMTITAKWKVNQYTITFDTDGGSAVNAITQDYGTAVTAPADPTKTGYTFDGWDKTIPANMPAEDMVITAKWTVNQYTIVFNTDGGGTVDSIERDYNATVDSVTEPTKDHYSFEGWYLDGNLTHKVTFPYTVTQDQTFYAKWTADTYTITYLPNGGSGEMSVVSVTYPGTARISANEFTRDGFEFTDWNTVGNGDGTSYEVNQQVQPTANITLYAQWEAKTVILTFVTNCDTEIGEKKGNSGDTLTIPDIANDKPGYRFDGWSPEVPSVMPSVNTTYTAGWTSYSSLLEAITDFSSEENLTRARRYYNLMKVDQEQLAAYTGTKHQTDLFAAIEEASVAQLKESVETGAVNIIEKDLLVVDNVTVAIVEVKDDVVDIRIDAPTVPAAELAFTPFLPELLNNKEIKNVRFNDLYEAGYGANIHTYTGITENSQMDLMMLLAFSALRDEAGIDTVDVAYSDYDAFKAWLTMDILVGAMDGKTVSITAECETEEGVAYTVSYTINFYNYEHTVTWNVDGVKTDDIYKEGASITAPAAPEKAGYTFVSWTPTVADVMGRTDLTYTAVWTIDAYKIEYELNDGEVNGINPVGYNVESAAITLINPTKTGHTFKGWSGTGLEGDENTEVVIAKGSTGDRSYTANWTVNEYTVTWFNDLDGDNVIDAGETTEEDYSYGTEISMLSAPAKTGYKFLGWDGYTSGMEMGTCDLTFKAMWEALQFTVTLNPNGGTCDKKSITVVYDGTYAELPVLERDGYSFDGWYTAATGGEKVEQTNKVVLAGGITLYAHWTAGGLTISYKNDNGTALITSNPTSFTAETETFTLVNPTRAGYTFAGWTGSNGNEKQMTVTVEKGTTENLAFVAHWTLDSYSVGYVLNGGTVSGTNPTTYTVEYEAITLINPTKVGHTFVGWSGTGLIGTTNKTVVIEAGSTGDRTYTANWSTDSYTVTWKVDGAVYDTKQYAYGTAITPPAVEPTKTGYDFDKWNGYTSGMTMDTADLTFEAKWTINEYTVTWNVDGVETVDTYVYNADIVKPADPAKEGHAFTGWTPAVAAKMGTSNLTYTATWSANKYDVTWDVDGKTTVQTCVYGSVLTPPADPAKEGYTFAGWEGYADGDATGAGDVTYTALWTINQYDVTWDVDGKTTTDTYDFGAAILKPEDPTKTGYTFAGWTPAVADTMPAEDVTYKAIWTVNKYTATWDVDGVKTTDTYNFGEKIEEPEDPKKAGYTFAGWTPAVADTMPAENVTYTAQWNEAGDTAYKVKHYQQTVDGKGYELKETDTTGTGRTGSEVSAAWKTYTGFEANAEISTIKGTVAADGSLVLKLYYDRKSYTVTWKLGEVKTESYLYGSKLAIPEADYENVNAVYTFVDWDKDPAETVTADATYTAQYEKSYAAVIVGSGTTYRTLELALANAKSGDVVRLESDAALNANATVPTGVTLLIPCVDGDTGYQTKPDGTKFNYDGSDTSGAGVSSKAKLYRSLTIPENVTLTINGTVLVNSVSGRKATAGSDQDITGGYAQINLEGNISVFGTLECFGYIKGGGQVTAENGGTVGDLFIVRGWRGGTHSLPMYLNNVYPMNQYDCRNIEAAVRINYGGVYAGLVKMYGNGSYHYARFPQVHVSNGIVRLTSADGYAIRTYENGREVYEIHGGANFAESTLTLLGQKVSTSDFIYPIEGDTDFILNAGNYAFTEDFKFMAGASVVANSGAHVTVNPDVVVVFYEKFDDVENYAGTTYPSDYPAAALYLKEGSSFTNRGAFGGTINTETGDIFGVQDSFVDLGESDFSFQTWDDIVVTTPVWGTDTKTFSVEDDGDVYTFVLTTDTKEANGYCNEEEPVITIQHPLIINREGYTWKVSNAAIGEEGYGSIIWIKDDVLTPQATVTPNVSAAGDPVKSVTVDVSVLNTFKETKTCTAWVAAYSANGKLLDLSLYDAWQVAVGENEAKTQITLSSDEVIDHIKVFVVDENHMPMGEHDTVSVK